MKRHKCTSERRKPVSEQRGAIGLTPVKDGSVVEEVSLFMCVGQKANRNLLDGGCVTVFICSNTTGQDRCVCVCVCVCLKGKKRVGNGICPLTVKQRL